MSIEPISRFDLYEWCVQAPDMQARFLDALHGPWKPGPRTLRDDFCGPASIARAWVRLGDLYHACGVDLDDAPLAHARLRAADMPYNPRARLTLLRENALICAARADVVCAFNFALCELHERAALVAYLAAVRRTLTPQGLFAADLYGGTTAFVPGRSDQPKHTPAGKVRYTWEQRDADPLTGRVRNAIHFTLPGKRSIKDAFTYDWRLWSVPEVQDAMHDAGFTHVKIHAGYGGATDEHGTPLPQSVRPGEGLDDDDRDAWVVYIVARA